MQRKKQGGKTEERKRDSRRALCPVGDVTLCVGTGESPPPHPTENHCHMVDFKGTALYLNIANSTETCSILRTPFGQRTQHGCDSLQCQEMLDQEAVDLQTFALKLYLLSSRTNVRIGVHMKTISVNGRSMDRRAWGSQGEEAGGVKTKSLCVQGNCNYSLSRTHLTFTPLNVR